jgi:phenylpyruvate tautomerase PptA (4-oxalocrotonate tautomerase family)
MPMLDVTIPEGALAPEAEAKLMKSLTDILIRNEGADPGNDVVQSIAWVFVNRPAEVYVAGAPADLPRYRVVASVPEGQFNDERRAGMTAEVTEAILDAEPGDRPRDPMRVWVFSNEIPDGNWGAAGQTVRLADIAALAMGDAEKGKAYADRVLAERRGEPVPA